MSSKVVFDLKAAIGSLNEVSRGSFRPVGGVFAFSPAAAGFWMATDNWEVDETHLEFVIWWTFLFVRFILIAGQDPNFPKKRTNAIESDLNRFSELLSLDFHLIVTHNHLARLKRDFMIDFDTKLRNYLHFFTTRKTH